MEAVRHQRRRPLGSGVALSLALLATLVLSVGAARAGTATWRARGPRLRATAEYRETGRWTTGDRPGPIVVDRKGRVLVEVDEKVQTYSPGGKRLGSFVTGVSTALRARRRQAW